MGLLWTVFFSASKLDGHWINAAIMSRPWTLSVSGVNGGVGWPGLRASAWWLEGLSKDYISFWLTAILYYKKSLKHSCQVRVLYATLGFFFVKLREKNPWSRVVVFWAYLKKYGCLLGKSDKRLRLLAVNQCKYKCRREICQMFRLLIGEKSHSIHVFVM